MDTGLSWVIWLLAVLVCLPMWVVIVEALMALSYARRAAVCRPAQETPRSVVLIPAHNEVEVIGQTLTSLTADLPKHIRMLCVAHNCSDGTADIARQFGADVIEVNDAGTGGKPDALKAGLRWLDADPPEVVVIVDADCVVSPGAVATLAAQATRLGHPVMGTYLFAAAEGAQRVATVSSLAVLLKNFIRPLGLHRLGQPCLLNGSGSAYPFEVIRNVPHGEGSIAEDYQLTIDLLRQGYATTFVPEARVDGQLPKRDATAERQRRRWEHGHLFLTLRTAPGLMLAGLARLDTKRIALGLELLVPPLAFLALMWLLVTLPALAFYVVQGAGPLPLLLLTVALFALAVLLAWMRFAGIGPTLAALAAVPRYLVWKLPIYRDFFARRETRWMKTNRD